jgi:MFS family permease
MNGPVIDPGDTGSPSDRPAPREEHVVPASSGSAPNGHKGVIASPASMSGLNWLNFLSALMQTGFGAFLAVYLTNQHWSRTSIGFVLSVGTAAAMASQVPAGMLVDWARSKRHMAAAAVLAIMAASVLIAVVPRSGPVYLAQILQGVAAAVLTPTIAALTLALSRQEKLGERLGRNVRYAAVGSAVAAAIMGLVGAWLSYRAIYWLAALCALPCLVAIFRIRIVDLAGAHRRASHAAVLHPRHHTAPTQRMLEVVRDPALLIFAVSTALFQLGNASLLPTAAGALTRAYGGLPDLVASEFWWILPHMLRPSDLLVAAWVVVPQLLAAGLSPWLGRHAQMYGRRRVLLIGFAVPPLRALLFAFDGNPVMMVAYQALDSISAAVLGVMIPLVVADITHRGGRFNLAIGIVGLASGVGGALSTAVGGALADRIGDFGTFLALGGAGLCACALLAFAMPETHAATQTPSAPARPAAADSRNGRASVPCARRERHHFRRDRRQA